MKFLYGYGVKKAGVTHLQQISFMEIVHVPELAENDFGMDSNMRWSAMCPQCEHIALEVRQDFNWSKQPAEVQQLITNHFVFICLIEAEIGEGHIIECVPGTGQSVVQQFNKLNGVDEGVVLEALEEAWNSYCELMRVTAHKKEASK